MKKLLERITLSADEKRIFAESTQNWRVFIYWLKNNCNELEVLKCLAYEIENEQRANILDRLRTRFNSIRARRELGELEEITNKVISLVYRK